MKKLIVILIACMAFISCSKPKLFSTQEIFEVTLSIPVYEQKNVSHFEIEASTDGVIWSQVGAFFATTNETETYPAVANVTSQLRDHDETWLRIKSVDNDQTVDYSPVFKVKKADFTVVNNQ